MWFFFSTMLTFIIKYVDVEHIIYILFFLSRIANVLIQMRHQRLKLLHVHMDFTKTIHFVMMEITLLNATLMEVHVATKQDLSGTFSALLVNALKVEPI